MLTQSSETMPTVEGWWWYFDERGWQVVRVCSLDGSTRRWARLTNGNLLAVDEEMEGVWAGPLTPPATPNDNDRKVEKL